MLKSNRYFIDNSFLDFCHVNLHCLLQTKSKLQKVNNELDFFIIDTLKAFLPGGKIYQFYFKPNKIFILIVKN